MKIRIKTAEELLRTEGVRVDRDGVEHRGDAGYVTRAMMERFLGKTIDVEMEGTAFRDRVDGYIWTPWAISEVIEDKPVEVVGYVNFYPGGKIGYRIHDTERLAREEATADAIAIAVKLTGSYIPEAK